MSGQQVSASPATRKRERPSHFSCVWCGTKKKLARTGRMPSYCSDYCRRAEAAAPRQLQDARLRKDSAERDIERLEGMIRHAAEVRANTEAMF